MTTTETRTRGKPRNADGEGGRPFQVARSGKWVAVYYVTLPDGSRVRRTVSADTQREAARRRKAKRAEVEAGLDMDAERLTVGEFLERWLEREARPTVKPSTFVTYQGIVKQHLIPVLGSHRLRALRAEHVRAFYTAKMAEGLSARTCGNMAIVLGRALKIARRDHLVTEIVTALVSRPKPEPFREDPLDREEIGRVLDAADGSPHEAIIVTLAATGLRLGEALGLTWECVDLDAGTVRVERALARVRGRDTLTTPKTQQSRRTVILTPRAVDALRRQVTAQKSARMLVGPAWAGPWADDSGHRWDLCFTDHHGRPLNGRAVRYEFDRILKAAGVRHVRIHSLRHGVASALLAEGFSARVVMDTLGHSQIGTTLGIYGHTMREVREDAAEKIARYIGG